MEFATKIKNIALVIALCGLVSACSNSDKYAWTPKHELPSATAQLVQKHYYVAFDQKGLVPGEKEELVRSLQDVNVGNVTSVAVYLDDQNRKDRVNDIQEVLKSVGIQVNSLASDSALENDGLIIIEEWDAFVENCPDWSKPHGTDYTNSYETNFGCSTEMNLAAMIVDPNDLNKGRVMDSADSHQGVGSIQRYRSGEITDIRRDEGVLSGD